MAGLSLTAEAVSEFLPLLSALYWPFWGHRGSIRDATLMVPGEQGCRIMEAGKGSFPPSFTFQKDPWSVLSELVMKDYKICSLLSNLGNCF